MLTWMYMIVTKWKFTDLEKKNKIKTTLKQGILKTGKCGC